jgi:hypothetical protein
MALNFKLSHYRTVSCHDEPFLVGWQTRITALCSGMLPMTFGLAMTLALDMRAPLNSSVFSATGGSLLLATCPAFPLSVDELRPRSR